MLPIHPDDLQLRVMNDRGYPTVRLILQGKKAYELLKSIRFSDPKRERNRLIFLDIYKADDICDTHQEYFIRSVPERKIWRRAQEDEARD